MRFLGKYELLEQLTVGKVETFAAYPIGGGERLLLHVFALPALIKSAPTNRDLLGYMEAIAPPALGTLLDAGRYDDGSQAYLVTKFPRDLSALPKWIEAYKVMAKNKHDTTAEVTAGDVWKKDSSGGETQEIPIPEKPPGDFTRAFQAIASPPGTPAAGKPGPATDAFREPADMQERSTGRAAPAPPPAPGSVTEQFLAGLGEGSRLSSSPPVKTVPANDPPVGAPAAPRSLVEDSWVTPGPAKPVEESPIDTSRPGEFTMFFKSPLAPPPASSEPFTLEESFNTPAPAPTNGEFTQMFGAAPPASRNVDAEPLLEPATQGKGFTSIFGKGLTPATPEPVLGPPSQPPVKPEPATNYVVSQNTNLPQAPLSHPPAEPIFRAGTALGPTFGQPRDEDATRLFRAPAQDQPAPSAPPLPPGESEYTRIISARPPAEPQAPAAPQASGGGAPMKAQVSLSPPPMPHLQTPLPHLAPPPAAPPMHWPPAPQVAAPKVPGVAISAVPAAKANKKPGGWTAWVPLIVILNLLLLAAVGLVLYFILQH